MHAPPLHLADWIGPFAGAFGFIALMSLIREPARRTFNAIFVAGASGAYLSGGLGGWELLYPMLGAFVAWLGLRSHRAIGVAWLMHAGWDLVHHYYGNPIWPFMPTSSFGCAVLDSTIAAWFLAGAPSLFAFAARKRADAAAP
ncbi:MAG TPA: DUF6010 family protein [Polyangiaceae bacterium]|nr:DUF6010 family protein [Polyangiaceae bacterium]